MDQLWREREDFYSLNRCSQRVKAYKNFHKFSLHLAINLITTYNIFIRALEKSIAEFDISGAGLNVLLVVKEYPGCTMSFLKEMLLLSGASITSLIDTLERKNLVVRSSSKNNKRSKALNITEEGHNLLNLLLPKHYKNLQGICFSLVDEELNELSRLLTKLRRGIMS